MLHDACLQTWGGGDICGNTFKLNTQMGTGHGTTEQTERARARVRVCDASTLSLSAAGHRRARMCNCLSCPLSSSAREHRCSPAPPQSLQAVCRESATHACGSCSAVAGLLLLPPPAAALRSAGSSAAWFSAPVQLQLESGLLLIRADGFEWTILNRFTPRSRTCTACYAASVRSRSRTIIIAALHQRGAHIIKI
eukprot:SAG31_NODE_4357_length_3315_cov_2.653918_5_plen_195_part_00